MKTSDFDYHLPDQLIARHPLPERGGSRLLHVDGAAGCLADRRFAQMPELFRAGDLLVFNDTRVIKARLHGVKATGGKIEALVERVLSEHEALVFIRASKPPRPGMVLRFADAVQALVLDRVDDMVRLAFDPARSVLEWLDAYGEVPLPPYLERPPEAGDDARYQTVYAREPGAVAAPTAGLHFDEAMLAALKTRGVDTAFVTLHVGAGTFQPVRVEDLLEHRMHTERYAIPQATVDAIARARQAGGRVCAVGTTSLRALEAAARRGALSAGEGETDLFITPGYRFRVVERLLTNFHLPRSTLLMLVSAFGGAELMRRAYAHAVASAYRFFSYGDAMLIEPADGVLDSTK
ncbi:MAG: S-adenosylmethionine:tRNA ribosyltransferase-isomerase [bacterium]|nr:MAG: S-adenosylmethionine:tRNA ribosyltransferase-isomerase [bacterium]KAF0150609.1 MAG: S-adenosylmethionine:tRNA ribosyltransferase-isomerase [bacterium]KAF0169462.1 MAG: S-adenosylmethionine:tRNA ribosyltransferase-isomerase [bacterium]TXT17303.1 MAG: S-adenosylmethionine:tRNA ribosyltransferase-isomerase [bacterium]